MKDSVRHRGLNDMDNLELAKAYVGEAKRRIRVAEWALKTNTYASVHAGARRLSSYCLKLPLGS